MARPMHRSGVSKRARALAMALLFGHGALSTAALAAGLDGTPPAAHGPEAALPAAGAQRIAEGWYAHQALLMTLGAGARIVATVNQPQAQPWMFRVQPSLAKATLIHGTAFNVEALLAAQVDLVFTSRGDRQALAYQQAGLRVQPMGYSDLPGLQQAMRDTAQALGDAPTLARAQAYNQYLDHQAARVRERLGDLPAAQRPTVLHIASLQPLKVDGSDTLIDQWIQLAGGRNAAVGLKGNLQPVSAEQLLAWQPDIIVLAANAGEPRQVPLWQALDAVQQHHVLRNPAGVFAWDRYGTEIALQLPWAAQQLHPERFQDLDMAALTRDFYQRFFDYALTSDETRRLLEGLPPG